jgi:hypothetical protein
MAMDRQTAKAIKYLRQICRRFKPVEVWVFGSRVRGDWMEYSDLDVIIVSDRFEKVTWPDRGSMVLRSIKGACKIQPFCYTPREFRKKRKQLGIIRNGMRYAIRIL